MNTVDTVAKFISKEYKKNGDIFFEIFFIDSENYIKEITLKQFIKSELPDTTSDNTKKEFIRFLMNKKTKNQFNKLVELNGILRNKSLNEQLIYLS